MQAETEKRAGENKSRNSSLDDFYFSSLQIKKWTFASSFLHRPLQWPSLASLVSNELYMSSKDLENPLKVNVLKEISSSLFFSVRFYDVSCDIC